MQDKDKILISQLSLQSERFDVLLAQVFIGIGFGLFSTPNTTAAMSAANESELSVVSASVNLARTVGNLFGMSLVALLIKLYVGAEAIGPESSEALFLSLQIWMQVGVGAVLIAAIVSLSRGRIR